MSAWKKRMQGDKIGDRTLWQEKFCYVQDSCTRVLTKLHDLSRFLGTTQNLMFSWTCASPVGAQQAHRTPCPQRWPGIPFTTAAIQTAHQQVFVNGKRISLTFVWGATFPISRTLKHWTTPAETAVLPQSIRPCGKVPVALLHVTFTHCISVTGVSICAHICVWWCCLAAWTVLHGDMCNTWSASGLPIVSARISHFSFFSISFGINRFSQTLNHLPFTKQLYLTIFTTISSERQTVIPPSFQLEGQKNACLGFISCTEKERVLCTEHTMLAGHTTCNKVGQMQHATLVLAAHRTQFTDWKAMRIRCGRSESKWGNQTILDFL